MSEIENGLAKRSAAEFREVGQWRACSTASNETSSSESASLAERRCPGFGPCRSMINLSSTLHLLKEMPGNF